MGNIVHLLLCYLQTKFPLNKSAKTRKIIRMQSRKKVLMACSNSWNSVFQVGSHHIAREFLNRGYEVAFVSDPISPLHLLKGSGLKKRFELYQKGGVWDNHLWSYVPGAVISPYNKPILRSEWVLQHWHQLTFPSVVKKVKANGFEKVDILYFDTPIQSFWLKNIQARKTVFRIADQNSGFKKTGPAIIRQEKKLMKEVDLVVCTAKTLVDQVPGSVHLPNGVLISHFSKKSDLPKDLKNISKPIAIYVGAIDYWFDFPLVRNLAKKLPHISFVLIGPVKGNPFSGISNIFLLGPKEYDEIPNYLKSAQVGIIPFDVAGYPELIEYVNPLKLYEYMACSLPVVATRWKELENLNSPAYLANSFEEFTEFLEKAIQNPTSQPREYAEKQDWSLRGAQLIELLKS